MPAGFALYFLYWFVPDEIIDYTFAAVIFLLGAYEVKEGLEERRRSSQRFPEDLPDGERSSGPIWSAYVGIVLEGGEALIYTFAVASSSSIGRRRLSAERSASDSPSSAWPRCGVSPLASLPGSKRSGSAWS